MLEKFMDLKIITVVKLQVEKQDRQEVELLIAFKEVIWLPISELRLLVLSVAFRIGVLLKHKVKF